MTNMLYSPSLYNGFAHSSPNHHPLGSPTGAPGCSPCCWVPCCDLLWGHSCRLDPKLRCVCPQTRTAWLGPFHRSLISAVIDSSQNQWLTMLPCWLLKLLLLSTVVMGRNVAFRTTWKPSTHQNWQLQSEPLYYQSKIVQWFPLLFDCVMARERPHRTLRSAFSAFG